MGEKGGPSEDTVVGWGGSRPWSEAATADHDEEDGQQGHAGADPGEHEVVSRELGVDAEGAAVLVELGLDVLEGACGAARGDDGCKEGECLEEEHDDHAAEAPAEQLAENRHDRQTDGNDRADVDDLRDVFGSLDVLVERARESDVGGGDVDADGVVIVDFVDDERDRVELVSDGRLCARGGREVDVFPHLVDHLRRALAAPAVAVHPKDVRICKPQLGGLHIGTPRVELGHIQPGHAELHQEDGALGGLLPNGTDVTGDEQRQRHECRKHDDDGSYEAATNHVCV